MEADDLRKQMHDLMTAHRENEAHLMRMLERQADIEAKHVEFEAWMKQSRERQIDLESLAKSVAESNIRISRII